MRIRKRLKEHRVDQTKDRRVSADPEAEDEYGGDGKAGRFEQETDGVAKGGHGGEA